MLNWALEHKDFDFKSILNFHQSNEDIVCFIKNLADLYDRERLFEISGLKCSEKQLKTESDEQYLKDNYVDTPRRLGHLSSLFLDIGYYEFPIDKPLPFKFLNKSLNRWGPNGYSNIRTQLDWCKAHPNFDYSEFLSLNITNSNLLSRLEEIDEYLGRLESEES